MKFDALRTLVKHALTEAGNETYDLLRIAATLGVFAFIGLALWNHSTFDPVNFGAGFGAVLLAAGGAFRINDGGKPTPPEAS